VKGDHIDKHDDIIDAEFVSEGSTKIKPPQQEGFTDSETEQVTKYHYAKKEYNSEQNQSNRFQSFSYSFGSNPKLNFKRPSIFIIILLIPFFLVVLMFFLVIGLITFVIFLPKIFNVIRKKGISGLKMDYNLLRGLFGHFKMK
jgi:maltodextrin utilization protein YvdJ